MENTVDKLSKTIPDSGNRTELMEGGGMRDIQAENGRCDLMPLDLIAKLIEEAYLIDKPTLCDYFTYSQQRAVCKILNLIHNYIYEGEPNNLIEAIFIFIPQSYSIRSVNMDNLDPVLAETLSTAILDLSRRYKEGAEKYVERNWEKGILVKSCLDSAVRHLLKWCREDSDENHSSAFLWNIVTAIWMHFNNAGALVDMPFTKQ